MSMLFEPKAFAVVAKVLHAFAVVTKMLLSFAVVTKMLYGFAVVKLILNHVWRCFYFSFFYKNDYAFSDAYTDTEKEASINEEATAKDRVLKLIHYRNMSSIVNLPFTVGITFEEGLCIFLCVVFSVGGEGWGRLVGRAVGGWQ